VAHFEPYPPGALVGIKTFAKLPPRQWAQAYQRLIADIRHAGQHHLHQLDVASSWRGCIDRVVLRGAYADLGLTVGHGAAAVWLDRRIDAAHRSRADWGSFPAEAEAWFDLAKPRFVAMLREIGCRPYHLKTALAA
jgi:hypothetical protein